MIADIGCFRVFRVFRGQTLAPWFPIPDPNPFYHGLRGLRGYRRIFHQDVHIRMVDLHKGVHRESRNNLREVRFCVPQNLLPRVATRSDWR